MDGERAYPEAYYGPDLNWQVSFPPTLHWPNLRHLLYSTARDTGKFSWAVFPRGKEIGFWWTLSSICHSQWTDSFISLLSPHCWVGLSSAKLASIRSRGVRSRRTVWYRRKEGTSKWETARQPGGFLDEVVSAVAPGSFLGHLLVPSLPCKHCKVLLARPKVPLSTIIISVGDIRRVYS